MIEAAKRAIEGAVARRIERVIDRLVEEAELSSVRAEPVEALPYSFSAGRKKDGPSTSSGQTGKALISVEKLPDGIAYRGRGLLRWWVFGR